MSVHISPQIETVRCYQRPGEYQQRKPYQGVAMIEYMHPLCTVTGMLGKFSRIDFMEIMRHARDRGAHIMVVERQGGRRMPWATQIASGLLTGWWQIDLEDILVATGD